MSGKEMEHCMRVFSHDSTTTSVSLIRLLLRKISSVSTTLTVVSLVKFSKTSWWDFYLLVLVHYYPLKMAEF